MRNCLRTSHYYNITTFPLQHWSRTGHLSASKCTGGSCRYSSFKANYGASHTSSPAKTVVRVQTRIRNCVLRQRRSISATTVAATMTFRLPPLVPTVSSRTSSPAFQPDSGQAAKFGLLVPMGCPRNATFLTLLSTALGFRH